ncbi:MAG: flagellar hook-associated protein FlgK, partial [Oscillospiraceae bacterium]|nr:flagellar hook-associated protein FlgK [Oscillospiraceae bacterium]
MAISNSFSGFTAARLGLYAAQYGLNLTSNNTANINTVGYTRQVLQQESFRSGATDMYASPYSINIGNGVLSTGVNQIRDPYLDLRFRNESANVGSADSRMSTLNSLAAIFDEVGRGDGDGVIEKQLSDLMTQFQNLSFNAGQDEFDTLVRSSATTLAQLFNDYSDQLDDIEANLIDSFGQDIDTVNGILTSIQ